MNQKSFHTPYGDICYYLNIINTNAITLVFLPGLTADHTLFEKQIEYFENRVNVFSWDAPGHASSRPFLLEFSLEDKARWLHDIFATENITKPLLIGQSMGGYVSQMYIQTFPNSAVGFISIDSAPLQRIYSSSFELSLMKKCEPIYRLYPWKALLRDGAKGCATTEYGQSLMKQMMLKYDKSEYCHLAGHGYKMLAGAIEADLPYIIDCPAILICGECDRAGSTRNYNKRWAGKSGIPIKWIEGAGHNSNSDKPEPVNTIIEELYKTVEENINDNK